jgi:DNA repair protein RadC
MNEYNYPGCFAEAQEWYTGKGKHSAGRLLNLPVEARPRERLLAKGPAALSDADLLMVLLNTGTRNKPVTVLAGELLGLLDRSWEIPPVSELSRLAGLGASKAAAVAAMLEFGRRRWGAVGKRVRNPEDIFALVRHNADRKQERFITISLNGAHEALAVRVVTIGLVNRTIVHPREVFADMLADRAAAFAVAHNHPSGKATPSPEDNEITDRLKAASAILGLHFLDHLIFSETGWWSYRQNGYLQNKETDTDNKTESAPVEPTALAVP